MRGLNAFRVALFALSFALPFVDDASKASADDWDLVSTLARAEASAPEVQRATASAAVAQAHTAFAHAPVVGNPVVGIRALVGPDSSAATYTVSLGLPLDFSGRNSAWRSESDHMVTAATAMLDVARADSRLDAYTAYVDVAAAEGMLANARDREDAARDFLASIQARLNAGAATSLDVVLAQRELAAANASLVESEREVDAAKERFRHALDLGANDSVEVEELLQPEMPEGLTIANATTRALRGRRETAAWRAQEARFRAAEQRVRRDAVEPVTVAFEGERQGNRGPAYGAGGSLSVPLPIVRTAQADRAVMRSQAELSEMELSLARREIEREAAAAYRALTHLLRELAVIEDSALPAAEQSLALSERMLASGVFDVFRVLIARNDLYAQRQHRIDVRRLAWRAYAELEHALGGFSE